MLVMKKRRGRKATRVAQEEGVPWGLCKGRPRVYRNLLVTTFPISSSLVRRTRVNVLPATCITGSESGKNLGQQRGLKDSA